jgi:hypothetical protein
MSDIYILNEQQVKYSNIENIGQKILQELQMKQEKSFSTQLLEGDENKLLYVLGALVNDSLYKQYNTLKTSGIIKNITPLLNYINFEKVQTMIGICSRVQATFLKKIYHRSQKNAQIHPLETQVIKMVSNSALFKQKIPQSELILAFITGYNHYGQAIREIFAKTNVENNVKKGPNDELKEWQSLTERKNLLFTKPDYQKNPSFQLGIYLGLYYFETLRQQIKTLGTLGLLKDFHPFIRRIDLDRIKEFCAKISQIDFKILSIPVGADEKFDSDKKNRSFYLIGSNYELEIFELLNNIGNSFNSDAFFHGFSCSYSLIYGYSSLKSNNEKKEQTGYVSDEMYLQRCEEKGVIDSNLKISYLLGVMIQRLIHDETENLGTKHLLKEFSNFLRISNAPSILKIFNSINYTYLSIWAEKMKKSSKDNQIFYTIYPKLQQISIDILGDALDLTLNSSSSISLIQGYNAFFELWQRIKPKDTDDGGELDEEEVSVDDGGEDTDDDDNGDDD